MNQILVPQKPSPFRALLALRRPRASSHAEPSQIRTFLDPKRLTHADIRKRCSFLITELFNPIAAHERSNKALFRKVAKVTGLGMQRIERLWRQYIAKPDGLELAVLELARAQAEQQGAATGQGAAHVEPTLGAAVDYGASRWRLASGAGAQDLARGTPTRPAEDAD